MTRKSQEEIVSVIRDNTSDDTKVAVIVQRSIPKTPDFVMLYQEIGKKILEGNISLSSSKVFFYMIMNMSFENFIGIDQKSISDNIKMPLPTVKKAMKELKEFGMLISIRDNFDTRRNVYRLNPIVAWKGKVRSRIKAMKDNPEQIKMFPEQILIVPEAHPLS